MGAGLSVTVSRRTRRLIAGLVILPVGVVAVLGIEVTRARIKPRSDYGPVLHLDAGTGPTVVWMGDSTASGVGVSRAEDALPRQSATAIGAPERLVSLAVSGATVDDVLHLQLPHIPSDASIVVIDIGANDVAHGRRVATFRRHYEQVLSRLPKAARVVMLGVPDMGSPPRLDQPLRAIVGWRGRAFDRVVRALARGHGAAYVDIAGETGPAFRQHPGRYFFGDLYHPNAAGYALWARAVVPVLGPLVVAARQG
ncbi:MAG: hypothetical protein NVS3B12_04150 [Acidimicrobiales bacterium]